MDGLDFTALTDDQLVGLVRAALRECVARGGAIEAAARAVVLDEAERARVAGEAAEREAAKLRAMERERVAREAAEAVREQHRAREAAAASADARARQRREAERAAEAGRLAAELARQRTEREKSWLRRAAALVGRDPSTISLVYLKTRYGVRVLINGDPDRYSRDHLSDWHADENTIHTVRALIGRKPDLTAFSAEFRAAHQSDGQAILCGDDYSWEVNA